MAPSHSSSSQGRWHADSCDNHGEKPQGEMGHKALQAHRIWGTRDALNLDGGDSTMTVIDGETVK